MLLDGQESEKEVRTLGHGDTSKVCKYQRPVQSILIDQCLWFNCALSKNMG